MIKSLLLERISLRGICRVLKCSLSWLINFIERLYQITPEDLQFAIPRAAEIEIFCIEADELWSFVSRRANKRWIWLVLERRTRQIIALHIGDRSQESAVWLWAKVPLEIKAQAVVLTDCRDDYAVAKPVRSAHGLRETKRTGFARRTLQLHTPAESFAPCAKEFIVFKERLVSR